MISPDKPLRVDDIPPYLLGDIAHKVAVARNSGRDVIDLSQINPDLAPPSEAVDKLVESVLRPYNHRYSASQGISSLRQTITAMYLKRYGVDLCSDNNVVVTMGNKEGLAHLLLSILSTSDSVLVLTPSYPVHNAAISITGASSIAVPISNLKNGAYDAGTLLDESSDDFFERPTTKLSAKVASTKIIAL